MMFANRIGASISCSIWLLEHLTPTSARGLSRHRFQSCNTSQRPVGVRAEDYDLIAWLNVGDNLLHFRLPGFELALVANLEVAHLAPRVLHQSVGGNGPARLEIECMRPGCRPLRVDYP